MDGNPFAPENFGGSPVPAGNPFAPENFKNDQPSTSPLSFDSINKGITSLAGRLMGNSGTVAIPEGVANPEGIAAGKVDQAAEQERVAALRAEYQRQNMLGALGRSGNTIGGGLLSAFAQPVEYVGRQFGIKPLEEAGQKGQEISKALQPENQDLGDMLLSGAGSMAAFLGPGAAVSAGAKGLAALARFGPTAAARIGQALGAGASAGAETLGNAQSTYEDAKKNTGNEAYAEQQSYKDALANLPLNFIADKIGFFGGAQHRAAGAAYNAAIAAGKTGAEAEAVALNAARGVAAPIAKDVGAGVASEGFQEGGQQVLQNIFGHNPVGDQVAENAIVGGILGGVAGGGHGYVAKQGFQQAQPPDTQNTPANAPQSPPDASVDPQVTANIGVAAAPAGVSTLDSTPLEPPPVQRDETGQSVHPYDAATLNAALDPNAGPLTQAAGIAAAPVPTGEPTATEQARLNASLEPAMKQSAVEQTKAESELESANARVEAQRQQESEAQRSAIVDSVLQDSDVQNPVGKLTAELERAGYQGQHALPTADELKTIKRFQDVRAAVEQEHIDAGTPISSAPNELDVASLIPEKKAADASGTRQAATALPDDLIPAATAAKARNNGKGDPTAFFNAIKPYTRDEGLTGQALENRRRDLVAAWKAFVPPVAAPESTSSSKAGPATESSGVQVGADATPPTTPAIQSSLTSPASSSQSPAIATSAESPQTAASSLTPMQRVVQQGREARAARSIAPVATDTSLATQPASPSASREDAPSPTPATSASPSPSPQSAPAQSLTPEQSNVPAAAQSLSESTVAPQPSAGIAPAGAGRAASQSTGDVAGATASPGSAVANAATATGPGTGSTNAAVGTSDSLKTAHDTLVKSKGQLNPMQRRIIDGVASEAGKIRAGTAPQTTAYAKGLRAKADTIEQWNPRAADAVRVLADHVDPKLAPAPAKPLEKIKVQVNAIEAETGKKVTMTAPAHKVVADLHQQITTARAILSCL